MDVHNVITTIFGDPDHRAFPINVAKMIKNIFFIRTYSKSTTTRLNSIKLLYEQKKYTTTRFKGTVIDFINSNRIDYYWNVIDDIYFIDFFDCDNKVTLFKMTQDKFYDLYKPENIIAYTEEDNELDLYVLYNYFLKN